MPDQARVDAYREQCKSRLAFAVVELRSLGLDHYANNYQSALDLLNQGLDDDALKLAKDGLLRGYFWDRYPDDPISEKDRKVEQVQRYTDEGLRAFKMSRYGVYRSST